MMFRKEWLEGPVEGKRGMRRPPCEAQQWAAAKGH